MRRRESGGDGDAVDAGATSGSPLAAVRCKASVRAVRVVRVSLAVAAGSREVKNVMACRHHPSKSASMVARHPTSGKSHSSVARRNVTRG
jgi:hypothetical protein